jgi:hypothetical protein
LCCLPLLTLFIVLLSLVALVFASHLPLFPFKPLIFCLPRLPLLPFLPLWLLWISCLFCSQRFWSLSSILIARSFSSRCQEQVDSESAASEAPVSTGQEAEELRLAEIVYASISEVSPYTPPQSAH